MTHEELCALITGVAEVHHRMNGQKDTNFSAQLNSTERRILELAKPFLAVRNNDAHTRSAITFVLRLLETEAGDRDIVIPAIILHDVGYDSLDGNLLSRAWGPLREMEITRIHEREGARIAAAILEEVGYEESKKTEILQIIDGHDTRPAALSNNDRIVRDADKLTRYAKDLRSWIPNICSTIEESAARLERSVDSWFFLPVSKEIAMAELGQRRIEAETKNV